MGKPENLRTVVKKTTRIWKSVHFEMYQYDVILAEMLRLSMNYNSKKQNIIIKTTVQIQLLYVPKCTVLKGALLYGSCDRYSSFFRATHWVS